MSARKIDDETLRRLWLECKTTTEIAKVFGADASTVSTRAKALGLQSRRLKKWRTDDDARLRRLWAKGDRISEIARYIGCAESSVTHHAKRLGLPERRRADVANPLPASIPAPQAPATDLTGKLIQTKGKWSLLAQVAAQHGLTATQAQQRYHQARSGR